MRLEHHLVGGYARYVSPHIIIIIIIYVLKIFQMVVLIQLGTCTCTCTYYILRIEYTRGQFHGYSWYIFQVLGPLLIP